MEVLKGLENALLEVCGELFALCDRSGVVERWSHSLEALVESESLSGLKLELSEEGVGTLETSEGGTLPYSVVWRGATHLIVRFAQPVPSDGETEFHKQRMQTLGELAGGIAHDFNNILAGILGHVTYLSTVLPARGEHRESVDAIAEGARKASEMTKEILNFVRLGENIEPQPVEVSPFVERALLLLRGALSAGHEMDFRRNTEDRLLVKISEGKLMQVLANLCMNARDALEGPGSIVIRAGLFGDEEVYVSVEDNGCGIPPLLLSKIFDPFFSTKGNSGTGLGLSTSHAIVRQYGGRIEVESELGRGTRVTVYLPRVEEDASTTSQASGSEPARQPPRGRGERILVVDDDPAVRRVIAMSLEHLGYDVDVAPGGEEGVALYRERAGSIRLVMLDMLMPLMPGERVFQELIAMDPKVRVLVMSGYSAKGAVDEILENGGLAFIHKPFSIEELAEQVAECLSLEL